MLKILGISDDLTDILDELNTILDDPRDRYLLVLSMSINSIKINYDPPSSMVWKSTL